MKRTVSIFLVVLLMAGLLAGCGGEERQQVETIVLLQVKR